MKTDVIDDEIIFSAKKVSDNVENKRVTIQFEKHNDGTGYLIIRDDIDEEDVEEIKISSPDLDKIKNLLT